MPNPFAHVELSTDDIKKAKKFYSAVFAWKLNDIPAMSYTMIDVSGGVGGGMTKTHGPEQPPSWLPYVQVDDVKVTIAKVIKAGGKALLEYQDIGDMGAIGVFADPQGAALGVWAAKAPAAAPSPALAAKKAAKKAPAPAPAPAKKSAKKAVAPAPTAAPAKKAPAKKAPAKVVAPAPAAASAKKAPAKKAATPAPAPAPAKKAPAKKR